VNFSELKQLLFARGNFGVKLASSGCARPARCWEPRAQRSGAPRRRHEWQGLHLRRLPKPRSGRPDAHGALHEPHLNHFCERIRIAGEPHFRERACELLEEVRGRIPWALGDPGLTFFEIVTLMASSPSARSTPR